MGNSHAAFYRGHHLPPDALDELVVIGSEGNPLAGRPIPQRVTGVDGWDHAVFNAGIGW
jgi:hypothetical protein